MADGTTHFNDNAGLLPPVAVTPPVTAPSPPAGAARRSHLRPMAQTVLRLPRRLLRTHAFRLAGLYFLVFALSIVGVLFFVYWTSADFVERQTEATLDAEITGLAEQYSQRGLSGLVQIVAARSAGDRGDGMLYMITNRDGRPLAGNLEGWPQGVPTQSGSLAFTIEVPVKGHSETHQARGVLFQIPDGYRLLVGRDIRDAAAFRDRIRSALWWSGLLALAIGLAGGAVMSRNMLRRVEQVNRTAERVMAGNLSDRIPHRGGNDEFDQLAANLNGMLDQIERLMTGMREVTDNVAHDLKTPLARLRARLELALLGPDDSAARNEAIRSAIEEADRLLATFNALLSIAAAEAHAGGNTGEPLDIAEVTRAVVELYEPLAEEQGFALRLDCDGPAMIRGDRHLLSQAVANLLDNALKYGDGGDIKVTVRRDGDHARIVVADNGPGIAEADRDTVFDRFVRLERSRSTPGNGLGLSLVRAVAHRHDANVALADNREILVEKGQTEGDQGIGVRSPGVRPGLRVTLDFPALAAAG